MSALTEREGALVCVVACQHIVISLDNRIWKTDMYNTRLVSEPYTVGYRMRALHFTL